MAGAEAMKLLAIGVSILGFILVADALWGTTALSEPQLKRFLAGLHIGMGYIMWRIADLEAKP